MSSGATIVERRVELFETSHQQLEGGGFKVRRPIGGRIRNLDPFLLLDHMGPSNYGPGEAVGAPDHPHRGFETVTYIIDGGMKHQDSAGNTGVLEPGWVQWMTAGAGVVHSEMPTDELLEKGGRMEGFQLWVNLPKKDKMMKPRYQDTPPERIPVVKTKDGRVAVKVIAGESLGTKATIETRIPILYLDVHLQPGSSFTQEIPANYRGFAYVWRGSGYLGKERQAAEMGQVATMGDGTAFTLSAGEKEECRVLLVAGKPIGEPVVQQGPFVMNTREEILQAFADYQSGKLGQIDGSEERYEKTRKARETQQKSGRVDL
eukprot:m.309410 g.309410  ORF g.309410 m.309410 type:complete len:318 (+) comp46374_c0_seq1:149-1102(+)